MNTEQQHTRVITLLRLCTLLLAAVSFWSTAQGMKEYTFPAGWQAYLASLGVQGLLLGLNFSFFRFWRGCKTGWNKLILVLLTFVVLICSSWFSFLYIAKMAYSQSWATEQRLLAQGVYRSELFEADNYLAQYGEELEETLGNQLTSLYARIAKNPNETNTAADSSNSPYDWKEERNVYAAADFAPSANMSLVISAMEQATGEKATQEMRDYAANSIAESQELFQKTINALEADIADANSKIEQAQNKVSNADALRERAQRAYDRATDTTDRANLWNNLQNATQNYNKANTEFTAISDRQIDLVEKQQQYQDALYRVKSYSSYLTNFKGENRSIRVGDNLRIIQRELFEPNPNTDNMVTLAAEVFNDLQSAVALEENDNYLALLSDMSRFVNYLENYSSIKQRSLDIQTQIDALAAGTLLTFDESVLEVDQAKWMKDWQNTFNELKSTISGLPVYTGTAGSEALRSYSREDATARLDKAIRNYLTEHNTAQQGLIYLASPYRSIAFFSLILALLLDVAAFVTGFVTYRADVSANQNTPVTGVFARNLTGTAQAQAEEVDQDLGQALEWNARPPLNRYTFLTGDFQYLDGVRTYKAIENGAETELEYEGELPAGFYCWNGNRMTPLAPAELCYHGEGDGSRDGVYEKAKLQYEEQLLYIKQGKGKKYIGTVDPLVPLYLISKDGFDLQSVTTPPNAEAAHIVISLNQTGTRIIAVYVVN